MGKRRLTDDEIILLEKRGCLAEDWGLIRVADNFSPGKSFQRVYFSGEVELGSYRGVLRTTEGLSFPAGIDHSSLHDVRIGNDCLILRSNLASADVGDNVALDSVGALTRRGTGPFANATAANVLAEDGARSVLLWRELSSQLAHLLCHLKKHPAGLALEEMIRRDADALRLPRCVIGSGCRIRRVGLLRNVWLGEGALVDGAAAMEDCWVQSSRAAPARIGEGVAAREAVFMRGCEVSGGVRLEHCLVGEGVRLSNSFSGKHSLFFANSEFALGESACAMAGPFAVSHHKATLILACQCSFNTFGSGANSSNHHFKLGPLHGGMLRRGVRCGSGSYLFWPSDIGAFTTVVGQHNRHLDTVNFPFSLLIGKRDDSVLVPGVNLFSCGTFRDSRKWRDRDRRGAVERPLDLVNTEILSPYVLQYMEAGMDLLRRAAAIGADLRHGGAVIPAARFEPALRLYEAAMVFHLGERLLSRARAANGGATPGIRNLLAVLDGSESSSSGVIGGTAWRDWGGMLLSGEDAGDFFEALAKGRLNTPAAVRKSLEAIHAEYEASQWRWLAGRWRSEHGEPSRDKLVAFIERWRKAVLFRHECFIKDASKEFTPEAMLGFGVEGDAGESFRRVRGRQTEHPLMEKAREERDILLALASAIPLPTPK